MALHTLTDDGHVAWDCSECGQHRTAHVSHEEIQQTNESTIVLPTCDCGMRTRLKVQFTAQELQSMRDENGDTTPSYMTAQRHIALVKHMRAVGKSHDSLEAAQ